MVKYGPVARFALGLGFATAPNVESTLNLAAVVASTPKKQRIRIVGGTEIEDRLSLRGLSVHRIHDHEPGAGSYVLLEQAQHPGVCRASRACSYAVTSRVNPSVRRSQSGREILSS